MPHSAALPFTLKRSREVLGAASMTTTKETVHGLLHLDGARLVIQWRLGRKTQYLGEEIRTDEEFEGVRQVVVPLESVAGALVRRRWWQVFSGPRLILTATDLQAFEEVAGEGGLRLAHPAELVLRLRRSDRLAGEEFSAEVVLAVAELAAGRDLDRALPARDPKSSQELPRQTQELPPGTEDHS